MYWSLRQFCELNARDTEKSNEKTFEEHKVFYPQNGLSLVWNWLTVKPQNALGKKLTLRGTFISLRVLKIKMEKLYYL